MAEIDPTLPRPRYDAVSVVMPVHNALPYLDDAIRSILSQTFKQFEFVIFDDGSTDGSTERLREWAGKDKRIRLVEGKRNSGPAASSNRVVSEANGAIVARMDADDISHPDRLRRELEVLSKNPAAGLVGTLCDTIDGRGRTIRGPDLWRATRKSWFAPFPHGSIMFRRDVFDQVGGYREECEFWEDQDLFLRMSAAARILVVPEALYQHRHSWTSTRLASEQERVERSVDLMYRAVGELDRGNGYERLLTGSRRTSHTGINPRVFVSLGSLVLWAGGRPKMMRRLLRHGKLSADAAGLGALAWTAWASLSPSTLRVFMRTVAKLRNAAAGRDANRPAILEWAHPAAPPGLPERSAVAPAEVAVPSAAVGKEHA